MFGRLGGRLVLYLLLLALPAAWVGWQMDRHRQYERGFSAASALFNEQYVKMLRTAREREVQALTEQHERELRRLRRSDRLLRELQSDQNCANRPYDPCLRRFMELRDRAEAAGEL